MRIAVWYHCKISGSGIPDENFAADIVGEQMDALRKSGLADAADEIHLCVNGNLSDALLLAELAPGKSEVIHHGHASRSELPTFSLLRVWLPYHRGWAVLYHHSKGVTRLEQGQGNCDEYKAKCRRALEKGCVWNWRQCVADLERGYDAVGVNWVDPIVRPLGGCRMFAGNFWWARSDYLMELPPLPDSIRDYHNLGERMLAETWIGSASRRPKVIDYERPQLTWWHP